MSVRANLCAPQLISRDNLSDPTTFGVKETPRICNPKKVATID